MALLPGNKLGPYEILNLIGTGGMGEVYRAKDARIGRQVAIKILPSAYAENADRLRRFEQEVRSAGSLNHQNILIIHDFGNCDGSPYIVSELLEGETLRNRIRGGITTRSAIEFAQQIATGLAAAHEKEIVHRDLKPENIFITKDERIKLLDFGLAKLIERPTEGDVSAMQTSPEPTEAGVVLGTVAYMSPEQVRGLVADHRSDIFSFGSVLFEMLTGKRAFQADSPVETMTAILKEDPTEGLETSSHISSAWIRIVRHCLEKNPKDRYQSALDLAFHLQSLANISTISPAQSRGRRFELNHRNIRQMAAAALLVAMGFLLAFFYLRSEKSPPTAVAVRSSIVLPEKHMNHVFAVALSPDGSKIAFIVPERNGIMNLWVRNLQTEEYLRLAEAVWGESLFWSPDSGFIGFFVDGKLKRISAVGGAPQTICDAPMSYGGTWNQNGTILLSTSNIVHSVSSNGGKPLPVTALKPSERIHVEPRFLPDGNHFLYCAVNADKTMGIYITDLNRREARLLFQADSYAEFANGYLLFEKDNLLTARKFNPYKLQLSGEEIALGSQKMQYWQSRPSSIFSASTGDVLSYIGGAENRSNDISRLVMFDRNGTELESVGDAARYSYPRLDKSGRRITVPRFDPERFTSNIWLYELGVIDPIRLSFPPGDHNTPSFSPDGSHVAYISAWGNTADILMKTVIGSKEAEVLLKSVPDPEVFDFSPDGRWILYASRGEKTQNDIWTLPLFGDHKPVPYLRTSSWEGWGRFSPDGKRVAYDSDEAGAWGVYVRPFPDASSGKLQIALHAYRPVWRDDGKELFYITENGALMSVGISTNIGIRVDPPKKVFVLPEAVRSLPFAQDYDVGPGGQRILFRIPVVENRPVSITIVSNWTSLLKTH